MTIDLGAVREIDAQAYGEPGQRTFRLRVLGVKGESASLWVEKEQVQALSMAFSQVLAQLDQEEAPARDIQAFPDHPEYEFRVGRMAIGFDPSDGAVLLNAYELGAAPEDDENPDLRMRLSREQCASLNSRLKEIIVGGRPVCPLCGVVLDPAGHACIRSNGHSKQPIPEEGEEEEE